MDANDRELVAQALEAEYEILEELGRGGMALVFRARERELGREVAVKVLPSTFSFDAEFVERFQREARTAAQLEHPNIIPVYRVSKAGGVTYFVMKYLRGGSLSGLLRRRGRLSAPEIRRLLIDCAAGLSYAHQRGIVHRDIKPDNVMFDEFGQSVVTDFGIAKAASGTRLTGTGMSIGTPHYMSPEQARAQAIDGRSDIYSLGVLAYQCLTGQVPFDGEDSYAIGYQHVTEPLPQPQLVVADDTRLYETIKRMMMKDPLDRPQDCAELVAILQTSPVAAVGSLTAAESAPTAPLLVTPTRRPTSGRTAVAATAATGVQRELATAGRGSGFSWAWFVLLVGMGGAGAWWYSQREANASVAPVEALSPPPDPIDTLALVVEHAPEPASAPSMPAAAPESVMRAPEIPPPVDLPPPVVTTSDSGSIKIVGLPAGSSVLLDGAPVTSTVTKLPAGRHVVAISAPFHNFFEGQVEVAADGLLEYRPALVKRGTVVPAR